MHKYIYAVRVNQFIYAFDAYLNAKSDFDTNNKYYIEDAMNVRIL